MTDEEHNDEETLELDDAELQEDDDLVDFSPGLIQTAKLAGVDPDDFEDEDELAEAVGETITALRSKGVAELKDSKDDEVPDELLLDEMEISLSDDDVNADLLKTLRKMQEVTRGNMKKLADKIGVKKVDKAMAQQIDHLERQVQGLNAQNIQLRLDGWIASDVEVQKYLGSKASDRLDLDSLYAKRRRALVKKADRLAATMPKKNFRMEKAFDAALAITTRSRKKGKNQEPTATHRPGGRKETDDLGSSDENQLNKAKRKAGHNVGNWRRKHGMKD